MVSGSISLPSRGSFRLSLTVLVHYRWRRVFSLGGWSPQIPTRFLVSRGTRVSTQSQNGWSYGALTLCGAPFQATSKNPFRIPVSWLSKLWLSFTLPDPYPQLREKRTDTAKFSVSYRELYCPPNPEEHALRFRLGPVRSPLLGPSRLFSFPEGT